MASPDSLPIRRKLKSASRGVDHLRTSERDTMQLYPFLRVQDSSCATALALEQLRYGIYGRWRLFSTRLAISTNSILGRTP
jgi:hypothetical protein